MEYIDKIKEAIKFAELMRSEPRYRGCSHLSLLTEIAKQELDKLENVKDSEEIAPVACAKCGSEPYYSMFHDYFNGTFHFFECKYLNCYREKVGGTTAREAMEKWNLLNGANGK